MSSLFQDQIIWPHPAANEADSSNTGSRFVMVCVLPHTHTHTEDWSDDAAECALEVPNKPKWEYLKMPLIC